MVQGSNSVSSSKIEVPISRDPYLTERRPLKDIIEEGRIMVFSWNSSGAKISEYRTQPPYYFQGKFGNPADKDPSFPLFFDQLKNRIYESQPVIIFFATQRSRKPGDQFHKSLKQLFSQIMLEYKIGYSKLRSSAKIGAGGGSSVLPALTGLRNSIWVLNQVKETIENEERSLVAQYGTSLSREYSCGRGISVSRDGLASYLKYGGSTIALINCYMDRDSPSLKAIYTSSTGTRAREAHIENKNKCLSNIIRELTRPLTKTGDKIDFVVVAGDLGYRSVPNHHQNSQPSAILVDETQRLEEYENQQQPKYGPYTAALTYYDELSRNFQNILNNRLQEGPSVMEGSRISGSLGPVFPPTCDLNSKRSHNSIRIKGKHNSSPRSNEYLTRKEDSQYSWCNRVLYLNTSNQEQFGCQFYYSFDEKHMELSRQTAVIAEFVRVKK